MFAKHAPNIYLNVIFCYFKRRNVKNENVGKKQLYPYYTHLYISIVFLHVTYSYTDHKHLNGMTIKCVDIKNIVHLTVIYLA